MKALLSSKKLGHNKEGALEALLTTWSTQEAARVAGVGYKTLLRWLKEPPFKAALNAALEAEYNHSMACLRNEVAEPALTLVKTVHDIKIKPATRLQAATLIIGHAQDVMEMDDFAAELAEVDRAGAAGKAPMSGGHGAKFPRTSKRAILALLTSPNVAEAARAIKITPQTLRRWMAKPAFKAELWAAAGAAFAPAMVLIKRGVNPAIRLIRKFSRDMDIPAATRVKAGNLAVAMVKAEEMKALEARVAAAESVDASAANSDCRTASKMIDKKLYQRVQRLKALLSPINWPVRLQIIFAHAEDGRAAGTSVVKKDGRQVWLQAPDGYRNGEPVPDPRAV